MTVLVVDDDASVAEFCRQVLSQAGHAVLVVASGDEALAALDEHEIDVVVSDVIMPGMDGLDLLRSIAPGNGGPDFFQTLPALRRKIQLVSDALFGNFDPEQLFARAVQLGGVGHQSAEPSGHGGGQLPGGGHRAQ